MNTVAHKTKDLLYETRKRFYENRDNIKKNISIDLGFRKLFFSQTFDNNQYFIDEVLKPREGISVAVYVQNPQILENQSEDKLALDPAVCYRLYLSKYKVPSFNHKNVIVRKINLEDIDGVNKIYENYGMYPIDRRTVEENRLADTATYFVAEKNDEILGIVIGINHIKLFNSPEGGASLWGLAVAPQDKGKGIGTILIDYIVEHCQAKEINYIDLYVDYFNKNAIKLYEKMGFRKIPRFYMIPRKDK
jgi:ribosomal protein S18 acetylase RimI-like enzyme